MEKEQPMTKSILNRMSLLDGSICERLYSFQRKSETMHKSVPKRMKTWIVKIIVTGQDNELDIEPENVDVVKNAMVSFEALIF
jgi:hypothetical protein